MTICAKALIDWERPPLEGVKWSGGVGITIDRGHGAGFEQRWKTFMDRAMKQDQKVKLTLEIVP